ncbi:lipid A core - O-antigen ligase [Gottschalkia purinilytica]|uniref:Lipid A core-O-antigen ligase n=1 Tax=Gottschalkia purinilytica TaxID=1503 RepID=A0A0L0WCN4_GOTPU|nr:O-antigen ligase family protein [Gottschalkia purinilytica]KNF09175.1 lipid A core - O-antigen ligase [Gottschalkia purinilytica]
MELRLKRDYTPFIGVLAGIIIGVLLFLFPLTTAIKIVGGLVGTILTLVSPQIGLFLLVFIIPFVSLKYTTLLYALVMGSFILNFIINPNKKFKKLPFKYSIIFFIITLVFATVSSFAFKESIKQLLIYIIAISMPFLLINLIEDKKTFKRFIMLIILASLLVSLYGLYQYKVGIALDESWVDKQLNPDLKTRVYSTLENPNVLAEYLLLTIPLGVSMLWGERNRFKKLFYLGAVGVQLLCLLLTFSRGGWVGIAIAAVVFAFFVDRRLFIVYFLAGIGLILVSPDVILTRINTITNVKDSSTSYRFPLWLATIDMIRDYIISGIGIGIGAFRAIYPNYMRLGIIAVHSHNIYLQILVETGIFGFLSFIAVVINTFRASFISYVKGIDKKFKILAIGVASGMCGLLAHGLVENVFFNGRIIITFWVIVAIALLNYKLQVETIEE